MNNPNFGALLDKAPSEIERPKPLPTGTYLCIVKGLPKFDKTTKKQTEYVEFTLQPTAASDDVDTDELDAMGGFENKTIRATYYITEDALWRLKAFLEALGIIEGNSLRAMIEEAPNKEVNVTLRHKPSEDGKSVYAEIADVAAA